MQLDPLIWETVTPRTNMPKIVNESMIFDDLAHMKMVFFLKKKETCYNLGCTSVCQSVHPLTISCTDSSFYSLHRYH